MNRSESVLSVLTHNADNSNSGQQRTGYTKKSINIGEDLVISCAFDMCCEVLGESAANNIK